MDTPSKNKILRLFSLLYNYNKQPEQTLMTLLKQQSFFHENSMPYNKILMVQQMQNDLQI